MQPTARPGSVFGDPAFGSRTATADQSHGWVPLGGQQQAGSGTPSTNPCESVTDGRDFVARHNAVVTTRSYHGTPSNTPVYPGSNYLYSSADEHIVSFGGDATEARTAFAGARQILAAKVKGSHVAWMTIGFEQGDTSTGGDAAILASMAARLP